MGRAASLDHRPDTPSREGASDMSSMIPTPPRSIQIGGPQGGPPQAGGPDAADAAAGGKADTAQVVATAKRALALIHQCAVMEGDDQDAAAWHAIGASIAKQIGAEQQLVDKAMGAGPGVKLVRKSAASGAGY